MALLGRNSRGFGYAGLQDNETTRLLLRNTTSQQDYETTSGAVAGGASPELRNHGFMDLWILVSLRRTTDYGYALLRQTTSLRDNEWGGCRWSFAGITESRIDGIMELRIGRVGSKLKAQSLSIPLYTLYTFYTLLYSLYSQLMTRSSAKRKRSPNHHSQRFFEKFKHLGMGYGKHLQHIG